MPPGISNGVYFPVLSGISFHESLNGGYQKNTTFSSTCQFALHLFRSTKLTTKSSPTCNCVIIAVRAR